MALTIKMFSGCQLDGWLQRKKVNKITKLQSVPHIYGFKKLSTSYMDYFNVFCHFGA